MTQTTSSKTFFDIALPESVGLYFISDTHFGHTRLTAGCPNHLEPARPYETVDEMEKDIKDKWSVAVTERDFVVFLGDFLFGPYDIWEDAVAAILDSLPGYKLFVRGNHDRRVKGDIIDIRDYAIIRRGGLTYLCQHQPFGHEYQPDPTVLNRYKDEFSPESTVLVHGHTHSPNKYSCTGRKTFTLQNCVSWEAWYGMAPADRLYPANRTYVGKCNGHQVVANFSKEVHE